jgi:3-deoxy-D-manno-octulosonate 8-phosphate phosphatase (KDO 8-P phosphatase)
MASVKAVALDVDGVLTDGTFWWGADGAELKRFSFRDIMGLSQARKAGLVLALISGEDSPLVDRFAAKMGIVDVFKGCKDKGLALQKFAETRSLALSEVCFMGDDINDLKAMELAGMSAAPADAHVSARAKATFVSQCEGGRGAVRELVDLILARQGKDPNVRLEETTVPAQMRSKNGQASERT